MIPVIIQGFCAIFTALILMGGKAFKYFMSVSIVFGGVFVTLILISYSIQNDYSISLARYRNFTQFSYFVKVIFSFVSLIEIIHRP